MKKVEKKCFTCLFYFEKSMPIGNGHVSWDYILSKVKTWHANKIESIKFNIRIEVIVMKLIVITEHIKYDSK